MIRVPRHLAPEFAAEIDAAMRFHDSLGNRKTKAGALTAIGLIVPSRAQTSQRCAAAWPGDAWAIVGDAQATLPADLGVEGTCGPGVWATAFPITFSIACSTSVASARINGKSCGSDVEALRGAAPARRHDHTLGDFPQIDPIPSQLQRAASMRVIASRLRTMSSRSRPRP